MSANLIEIFDRIVELKHDQIQAVGLGALNWARLIQNIIQKMYFDLVGLTSW